ncbi:MAG TPA: hypothetical protein VME18_03145 [Acidobacteriaceae bacterium]|nr:hypothetical protein [Acidobacteriaceae bacterium]
MSNFQFKVVKWRSSSAAEWLETWARLSQPEEEVRYRKLIADRGSLSPEYIVRVGRWKDSAETDRKWRPNVASVAYLVWMAAADVVSECPPDAGIANFLERWAERKYTDEYAAKGKRAEKRFGMSRATTLLHFISRGRYPIVDARVKTALARITSAAVPKLTPTSYMEFYCPLLDRIAVECGTESDRRKLDNALFYFGAWDPNKLGLDEVEVP